MYYYMSMLKELEIGGVYTSKNSPNNAFILAKSHVDTDGNPVYAILWVEPETMRSVSGGELVLSPKNDWKRVEIG